MRLISTSLFLVFFSFVLFAHDIPNKGFEEWAEGNPVGWFTTNEGDYVNVFQTDDRHSGSYAVRGIVADVQGFPYPPILLIGDIDNRYQLDERYASLHGWYKFTSNGTQLNVIYGLLKGDTTTIGAGSFVTLEDVTVWKEFAANTFFASPDNPEHGTIVVMISGATSGANIGAEFFIDDLEWSMTPASVDRESGSPESYSLEQNYPNPFNPSTNIVFTIPETGNVTLKVYDILGNEIQTLVNEELAPGKYRADFNGSNLASGTYFYKITAKNYTQTKQMMLLK